MFLFTHSVILCYCIGTTGSDIGTRRLQLQRTWTTGHDDYDHRRASDGMLYHPATAPTWILDPRIPARLARTASVDIAIEHGYDTHQRLQSHHTNDSDWTNDTDLGNSPGVDDEEDSVFPADKENSNNETPAAGMDTEDIGEVDWKRRMSGFANKLPNFALGSTTREFTQRRRRIFSDNSSGFHDAVSLEKRSWRLRSRRGTASSSGKICHTIQTLCADLIPGFDMHL